jgi:site-specific recombinase
MNEKRKVLSKQVALAGNSFSAAAFTTAGVMLYGDGTIHFENFTLVAVLVLVGIVTFAVTTWLLYEMAGDSNETKDDDG